jgi:RNA polymerase sigma-70 factor (ECF subfamily)
VDHLFRREAGRLVAILTKRFGIDNLQLVEDVVQDALVAAMQTWPLTGMPQNPTGWLLQAARNRAIDLMRRDARWRDRQAQLAQTLEQEASMALMAAPVFEDELRDNQLRMMFVCCDPTLPMEAQVALVLKTLCGLGEREIAAAFLSTEAAVIKRLVRARKHLRKRGISFELPARTSIAPRREAVLQVLYLLFNEGYKASYGDELLRTDLCREAIRLAELLLTCAIGQRPEVHALLALMLLNFARLPTRTNDDGSLLLLPKQDRTRWDATAITRGMRHLELAATGPAFCRYHVEAGIAACHALAQDFAATDWPKIISLYDQLLALDPSPIVALNRAVALAQVEGPRAGLAALENTKDGGLLEGYYLFHAVSGHLHAELGDKAEAARHFQRALGLATLPQERLFLQNKLDECRAGRSA